MEGPVGADVPGPYRGLRFLLREVQFALTRIKLVLVLNVLPDLGFIQTHGADAVSSGPKMQAGHPSLVQQLPMDPNRTLALQEPNHKRHAELRRDRQAHVDVVRLRLAFQQFHTTLPTQFSQNLSYLCLQLPVQCLPSVLRDDHHMVLAVPPHVGQALPLMHRLLLPAPTGLPRKESLSSHAAAKTPDRSEATRVSPPEAEG